MTLWFTKIRNALRTLGMTFILMGLSIGIVAAQGVFLLPDWIWFIFNIIVRIFALYLCARSLKTFLFCRITPTYSGMAQLTASTVCQIAGCLGLFSLACSFMASPFFSVVSFVGISTGFLAFLFTEDSLRSAHQWAQKAAPSRPHVAPASKLIIFDDIEDSTWAKQIEKHLYLLIRRGCIELWDQTKIPPGAISRDEMRDAIESAQIALVLMSTNLLNSDYIMEYQLPTLLHYAQSRGTLVIPIKARSCHYEGTGLETFQPVLVSDKHEKTLAEMSVPERDAFFARLTEVILLHLGER